MQIVLNLSLSLLLISLFLEPEKKEWEVKYVAMVPPFNQYPQISEKVDFPSIDRQGIRIFFKACFLSWAKVSFVNDSKLYVCVRGLGGE